MTQSPKVETSVSSSSSAYAADLDTMDFCQPLSMSALIVLHDHETRTGLGSSQADLFPLNVVLTVFGLLQDSYATSIMGQLAAMQLQKSSQMQQALQGMQAASPGLLTSLGQATAMGLGGLSGGVYSSRIAKNSP